MGIFHICSTTQTLLILSSFCECFLVVLLICDGENNGNAAFGTIFGTGNKYGKVEPRSKVDMLSGLRWGADPLPASMSSNSKLEWLPASMSISTHLLERMFRKNAMSYQLLCPVRGRRA